MHPISLTHDAVRDPMPGDTLVLWLPLFMGVGVGGYFAAGFEPSVWAVRAAVIGAAALVLLTMRMRFDMRWRWAAGFVVAASVGLCAAQMHAHARNTVMLDDNYWNATVTGTVESTERAGGGWRVVVRDATVNDMQKPYRLRLTVRGKGMNIQKGAIITVRASLLAPSPPLLPGLYDFQRHAYFQGFGGYGYVTKILDVTGAQNNKTEKTGALARYRDYIGERVYATLPQPRAGVTAALLNGQRGGIARATTEHLQQSGLQHVISISGLHVGLMAGIVFYVVRLLLALSMRAALLLPIKKIAAACALVAIILYMVIVGDDPATLRAVIMTAIVLCAVMLDRMAIHLRLVAIAAMVLLLLEPQNAVNIGFQLSFMAVAALVYFYQETEKFWTHAFWNMSFLHKILRVAAMTTATTMVVTAATAPLVFVHFQQVPLLSVVSNILAGPVIAFVIMPATFAVYVLSGFPMLLDMVIAVMGWGVGVMLDISVYVSRMPMAVWRMPSVPMEYGLLFAFGVLTCMIVRGRIRFIGVGIVAVSIGLMAVYRAPDMGLAHGRAVLWHDRGNDTLYVDGRMDRFSRDLVRRAFAAKNMAEFPPAESGITDMNVNGHAVRLVRTVPALDAACDGNAAIIMTRYYVDRPCRRALMLDRRMLEKRGGVALWLDNGGAPRLRTVHPYWGRYAARRPWQTAPRRWSYTKRAGTKRAGGWFSTPKTGKITP